MVEHNKAWTIVTAAGLFAVFYAAYIYILYSPGLILWQPDFLAFMNGGAWRFFPGGYGALVRLFGGGVVAGRMLTAFGLALVICILAASVLRQKSAAILFGILAVVASLASPSVFSNTLSPSVDMLYSAFGLSLLAACFIIAEDNPPQRRRYTLQFLLIAFLSLWLWQLRYPAPVLLFAAAIAMMPSWRKREALSASILLAVLGVLLLLDNKPMEYSSAAKEQIWCGLEFRYHRLAERGVLDGQPRAGDVNGYVWDDYGELVRISTVYSYLDYYSPLELAKHGISNYIHYLRRPLVLLGIASALAALRLSIRRRQALCALVFLILYPLPLSAAYYTLRASLLTELVGLALAAFFACELLIKASNGRRVVVLCAYTLAFLAAIAMSVPRLLIEMGEWRSQLSEASAAEKAVTVTNADLYGIWTEDTGITVRVKGEPIADMSRAFNSWLSYSSPVFGKSLSASVSYGDLSMIVNPAALIARKATPFRLLLIRTPELAQEIGKSGEWQAVDVHNGTKVLYILERKSKLVTPTLDKQ